MDASKNATSMEHAVKVRAITLPDSSRRRRFLFEYGWLKVTRAASNDLAILDELVLSQAKSQQH